MRRRRRLASALSVVTATVVLAGCGSSHPAANTSTATGSHPTPTTAPAPASSGSAVDQTSTCQDWASAASSARLAFANNSPELEQQINQLCQAEPNKAMAKVEDEYTTACENAQSDPSSPIDKACGQ